MSEGEKCELARWKEREREMRKEECEEEKRQGFEGGIRRWSSLQSVRQRESEVCVERCQSI